MSAKDTGKKRCEAPKLNANLKWRCVRTVSVRAIQHPAGARLSGGSSAGYRSGTGVRHRAALTVKSGREGHSNTGRWSWEMRQCITRRALHIPLKPTSRTL